MRYKDPSASICDRVRDLLGRMSLPEKIGQLLQPVEGWKACTRADGKIVVSELYRNWLKDRCLGAIYGLFRADAWTGVTLAQGWGPREGAEAANAIQRFVLEHTRLAIPVIISEECPHGHMAIGATVFPAPITQGATWNPELLKRMAGANAGELRARGAHVAYAPVLDLAQDPRWSRCEESFGEDPHLAASLGAAVVRGLQSERPERSGHVLATLKHFGAHGRPAGGHNSGPLSAGERELRSVLLAPFEACVRAGAASLMSAYHEIDGVPSSGNPWLLSKVLRDEWGFAGFVVSDGGAVDCLHDFNFVAPDLQSAAALALNAGVDLCLFGETFALLERALAAGQVSVEAIDRAVARVLEAKFRLGLFEHPFVESGQAEQVVGCAEHRALALEIARQGIVLLENKANLLPLSPALTRIAVIGPNADEPYNQLGDYTAPQPQGRVTTVLQGIRQLAGTAVEVLYARGCRVRETKRDGFEQALKVAREADVIVAVMGGSSARDFNIRHQATGAVVADSRALNDMDSGEGVDRATLSLAGVQLDLLRELKRLGKPLVVVLIKGRPLELEWLAQNADALLDAGYPGQEGGQAVAEILFGRISPSGRLTMSVPKQIGQLPVYYNQPRSAWRDYLELDSRPRYAFGYGLSFAQFSYDSLHLSRTSFKSGESVVASVRVTNAGSREADEVVQWFITDKFASVARPERELKHFQRVRLAAGESQTLEFRIKPCHLELLDSQLRPIVEPGAFLVWAGGRPDQLVSMAFEICP